MVVWRGVVVVEAVVPSTVMPSFADAYAVAEAAEEEAFESRHCYLAAKTWDLVEAEKKVAL